MLGETGEDIQYINDNTSANTDPLQFAYGSNSPVDDAAYLAIHTELKHLECKTTFEFSRTQASASWAHLPGH